jgi:5-methylcytosine-specific restriction endonuclease McrA
MARKNFSKSVIVACIKRATKENVVYCEGCGLPCRKWQIDHIRADGLLGEPTIDNARLLCLSCHSIKTKDDVAKIAKAKRVEAKHLGAKTAKQPIKSRGFAKKEKKPKLDLPPRRPMFE